MNIAEIADVYLIVANLLVALFQLALAFGAPMGEYAWGGRHSGKLPAKYRLGSLVSAGFLIAVSGHYASLIGLLPSMLDAHGRAYSLWALTALTALSTLGNWASKSPKEKQMFLPVSGSMLLANILILVFYRLG
jgi:ABC-type antimicrobial peptide transport system permease subunit